MVTEKKQRGSIVVDENGLLNEKTNQVVVIERYLNVMLWIGRDFCAETFQIWWSAYVAWSYYVFRLEQCRRFDLRILRQ